MFYKETANQLVCQLLRSKHRFILNWYYHSIIPHIHCATYTVRKLIHVRQSSMIFLCSTLLYSRRLSTLGENKFWNNIIILLLKKFSYIVFVSKISCRYCLTNVSVLVVFPKAMNLLCKLLCGGRFRDLVLDPFYRIIETGLIYLSSLNPYHTLIQAAKF